MSKSTKFYVAAFRFLSYRSRSIKEVSTFLAKRLVKEKDFTEEEKETIQQTILSDFIAQKFLNDEQFAKEWTASRLKNKGRSLLMIKRELQEKGIAKAIIEQVVATYKEENAEESVIEQLIEKRLKRYREYKEAYEKIGQFLLRRGFSFDVIKPALTRKLKKEYNKDQ